MRNHNSFHLADWVKISFVFLVILGMAGCEQPGTRSADESDQHQEHKHPHDSEATKKYAANDGHSFTFEPHDYAGEWGHTFNSDLIQIFILDKTTNEKKRVQLDSISIRRGDQIFSLDAENEDEQGLAHTYSLDNKELAIAMNLGVTLEMTVGEKNYTAKIAPHSH